MKSRISSKSAKPHATWSRRLSRPSKPAKLVALGIGESIKHKLRVVQVYRFQNWYQSNTLREMLPLFKTEKLIYQSKTCLFGKITNHVDTEIRKILVRGFYGNKNFILLAIMASLKFKIYTMVSFRNKIYIYFNGK